MTLDEIKSFASWVCWRRDWLAAVMWGKLDHTGATQSTTFLWKTVTSDERERWATRRPACLDNNRDINLGVSVIQTQWKVSWETNCKVWTPQSGRFEGRFRELWGCSWLKGAQVACLVVGVAEWPKVYLPDRSGLNRFLSNMLGYSELKTPTMTLW